MIPANDNTTATWSSVYYSEGADRFHVELRHGEDLIRQASRIMSARTASAMAGTWLLLAMRGDIPATPMTRLDAAIQEVQERRMAKRPPQEFDTSALPLFGDQRHQLDLF
ncbi:hypothetical protein [Bosea minatitlanensis]|uniref:Uncharacterized protein n=1 Tax=Bosea minatitlanensis TaxID=128782 RepID=A0ABW0EYA2_9HYPH|nr:hypothetical protein [Bosea minatitlanensis]MCT4496065.1 hypothetical protein [Bosea minatitlanensis]